jgi:hypothetical protein
LSNDRSKTGAGPAAPQGPHAHVHAGHRRHAVRVGCQAVLSDPKGKGGGGGGKLPLLTTVAALTAVMSPNEVRSRVRSTVSPGATQVMVKITGGGRGMKAIAAHFRYIGRQGKEEVGGKGKTLEIEDERGEKIQGREGLVQLTDEWRVAGAYIDDDSPRREAFNIVFSMPVGTPPEAVRAATAEAARELFEGHKYVFVMHEDQGAPHVHLSVRADRYDGVRLSPRKADLDRWRAVFARNLQDRGVNAVASRQPVRAANRNYRKLWEERAAGRGQLIRQRPVQRTSARALAVRVDAIKAWEQIARALASSNVSVGVTSKHSPRGRTPAVSCQFRPDLETPT